MNLNKWAPRLSIRAKLVIAFAGLAVLPVAAVSAVGTAVTITRIRQIAALTLRTDLEKAELQTARALQEAERHVDFIEREILGPVLLAGAPHGWAAAGRTVLSFLGPEPIFHSIAVVDLDGRVVLRIGDAGGAADEGGLYYAWRAAETPAGGHQLFPVELRVDGGAAGPRAVAAVAIVVPVRGSGGELRGAVVGEVYAEQVFSGVETSSPGFEGVTGVVDGGGSFLYHSSRQRRWASSLVAGADSGAGAELTPAVRGAMALGRAGTIRADGDRIVGYRPLRLAGVEPARVMVYRVLPLRRLESPVRRFVAGVLLAGILVVGSVLVLGVLAADQFTRPIRRLREAARAVAGGGMPAPLTIATNDEIEDLAGDFEAMGREIAGHRGRLEQLVAERTQALEATMAELATVLEGSADAIIGLDTDGRVRLWNQGAQSLFGYSETEVVGRPVEDLIGPDGAEGAAEQAYIAAALEEDGAIVGLQTTRRTSQGRPVRVSLTQTLLCAGDGCALGSSLIVRDNQMQARLDEHMRRSERLAAVSVMAAGLAHEINNPLGILANRIECMQRDAAEHADPPLSRDLEVLAAHVERLRGLTTDLLRFARDDDGKGGPVHLDAVASRLVTLLERTFVTRNLRLAIRREGPVPPVHGNEKALETVIMNLLLNAADATPSGGAVAVGVRLARDGDSVELVVTDTGSGIAPAVRERIFEPFFTTKGPRGGTGLGLAVCRSIVERHGGSIEVESVPGRGASFTVTVPLQSVGVA